jgi:hypothetical protein
MDEPKELIEIKVEPEPQEPHIHTKHKVMMAIAMQPPDELLPRHIHLHFCEGCHLVWWEEIKK